MDISLFANRWIAATFEMFVLSAPWLLFGFLVAGVMRVLVPTSLIERHLKKPGLGSVFKAAAIGLPLPLCSCGVIPVGVSLRRHGASKGATASFLISTPEIGVDSFFLSYALLGPVLAVTRALAAFVSAMCAGVAIDVIETDDAAPTSPPPVEPDCCAHEKPSSIPKSAFAKLSAALKQIFHYGFVESVDDLAVMLIIGFLGAGLITAVVPDNWFNTSGLSELNTMFLMLVVSLPLYVCAASSTPLAAALMVKGLSPGAALVFLLAGPASNVTTMLAITQELGKRALAIYLLAIGLVAMAFGFLLNRVFPHYIQGTEMAASHEHGGKWDSVSAAVLAMLLLTSFVRVFFNRQPHGDHVD